MTIVYNLTPRLRAKLKQPLGTLICGSFDETTSRLKDLIGKEKFACIISVGDTVTGNLTKHNITLKLAIIDNMTMRKNIRPLHGKTEKTIHVKNPSATITAEAISAISDALRNDAYTKIIVDGEEDLLALVAIMHAPENALVVYGQPHEGVVAVKVTPTKKANIAEILESMKSVRKTK